MSEFRLESLDNQSFYKWLIQIATPIAFQSLMLALAAACDALMLVRVAQEQMTAAENTSGCAI